MGNPECREGVSAGAARDEELSVGCPPEKSGEDGGALLEYPSLCSGMQYAEMDELLQVAQLWEQSSISGASAPRFQSVQCLGNSFAGLVHHTAAPLEGCRGLSLLGEPSWREAGLLLAVCHIPGVAEGQQGEPGRPELLQPYPGSAAQGELWVVLGPCA